ncbi:hypothetical protein MPLA_810017 [Mesorhizobium sp. ORS 3359]|nr:hypothetical protein MPLA_810017 [Mesorhizobium sp. ORS 3359]
MTRSNFCSASLDTATSPSPTKVAGNGRSPAISLSMPLCMIIVPCLLVPFSRRGCASCILGPATSFAALPLPPANGHRNSRKGPAAGSASRLPTKTRQYATLRRKRRRDIDRQCTITPVPYRTEKTNQATRGIAPRHEFCHFVLADSGWVRG